MIPASHPYEARYRHDKPAGGSYFTTKPVIAWDATGTAQVADEKTGQLRDANTWSNFAGVVKGKAPVVAAIPGGTWRAEYSQDDEGSMAWSVLAWLVHSDGECTPVHSDRDGAVDDPTTVSNFVRLYQPEEDTDSNGTDGS
ncbi:hypothetical protein [Streptomyces sp. NPDC008121]|uniref:hypothetical protein n=1 Tax=Streptomyces sp. NPDC008121 TaxID=3364809 RepID=UPI0036E98BD8